MKALIILLALVGLSFGQDKHIKEPIGYLNVNPTIVQTGTKPMVNWVIYYPSNVGDMALFNPNGAFVLQKDCYVAVHAVGVTKEEKSAYISVNNGNWAQLFFGGAKDVNPNKALYIKKLNEGVAINFGGAEVYGGSWATFYNTKNSRNILILKNGDKTPPNFSKEAFLAPYLTSSGTVKGVSPLSVLVCMELGTMDTQSSDWGDVVLMLSFSSKRPNNGHGNNLDGVDPSNPGAGMGGPNGIKNATTGLQDIELKK